MPVGFKERPTFFEIFKARCSKADLGPISLNWFEELSSKAPLYQSEPAEESEYKVGSYEPNFFKTPQRKPCYNQLASTPVIFKEQGRDVATSKRKRHFSMRLTVGPVKDMTSPPPNSCLCESPLLQDTHVTPQREKSVVCGNLFHTPKLAKGQTPKRISESLGAEVDPDMSWSSSLATPPTLSSTVLIVRDEEASETVFPYDSTPISKNYFSKHKKSQKENDWRVSSVPENENKNQGAVLSPAESGEVPRGLFGDVNRCEGCGGSSVPCGPGEDTQETVADISEADSVSLCITKYKTGNTQKMKTGKTRETIPKITKAGECEDVEKELEENRHSCAREMEASDSSLLDFHEPDEETAGSRSHTVSGGVVASSASPWSPLTPSGLSGTQMEKRPSLSMSCGQSHLEKDLIGPEKECPNLMTSESSLPHISGVPETEKRWPEERVASKSHKGQKLAPQKTSVLAVQQVAAVASQSATEAVVGVRPLAGETCAVRSDDVTPSHFQEKPEASNSGWEIEAACSQKDGSLCPSSVGDGSCSATPKHASVALKNVSLIATLRKKTKKFIYSISDKKSSPEGNTWRNPDSRPTQHSGQFEANCVFADADSGTAVPCLLRFSVQKNHLQNEGEEPARPLTSSLGTILRESSSNKSSSTDKELSQGLYCKEARVNSEEVQSSGSTETHGQSCLQGHHGDKFPTTQGASDVKEEAWAVSVHPVTQHSEAEDSSVCLDSPRSSPCGCGGTASACPSPPDPRGTMSGRLMIARERSPCEMSEELSHKGCVTTFELIKNIPPEKNQEMCALNENCREGEWSLTQDYVTTTSPSVKVWLGQNTDSTVVHADQEDTAFISKVTVSPNLEEFFQENEENSAPQVMNERNMAALEGMEELPEEHFRCAREPILKTTTRVMCSDRGYKQAAHVLMTEVCDSSAAVCGLTEENRHSEEQRLTGTLISQDLKSDVSLETDTESSRNNNYAERRTGLLDPVSNHSFRGFRTASNKEIKLSEHRIQKSKVLFRDIEDQYPRSLACAEIVGVSLLDSQQMLSRLDTLASKTPNPTSGEVWRQAFVSDSGSSHTAPQTLSLKQDFNSSRKLTPSEKAEITELSTILEESGSQFEFTQFRKRSHVTENTLERSENQLTVLHDLSEDWKDVNLDLTTPGPSASQTGDSQRWVSTAGDTPDSLTKNHVNQRASGCPEHKEKFVGFCSAGGTQVHGSSTTLQGALRLFSDTESLSEDASTGVASGRFSLSPSASIFSVSEIREFTNDRSLNKKHDKCQLTLPNSPDTTAGVSVKGNPERGKRSREDQCAGPHGNTCKLSETDGSDSAEKARVCVCEGGGGQPPVDDEPSVGLRASSQSTMAGNGDITEGLSDLTCLEVVKPEETFHVDTSEKEEPTCNKMEQSGKDLDLCDLPVHTASRKAISISKESFSKVVNLFGTKYTEENSINLSDSVNSKLLSGISKNKKDCLRYKERNTVQNKVWKEKNLTDTENKLTVHPQAKHEMGKTGEPPMLGFHTASGKKVTVTKASLDKVRNLFDENKQGSTSEISNFYHRGTKRLQERGEHEEGLAVACEAVGTTPVPKSGEVEDSLGDSDRNCVSNKTLGFSRDRLCSHTENLRASNDSCVNDEVHENTERETAECPVTCDSSRLTDRHQALEFYTGRGGRIGGCQTSVLEAGKWLREGELGDERGKRNAGEAGGVQGSLPDCVGNPSRGGSSGSITTENGNKNLSEKQDLSYLSNSCSYRSGFCHLDELHHKSWHLSKIKKDNSGIEPLVKDAQDRKSSSICEVTSPVGDADTHPPTIKEDTCVQKCVADTSLCRNNTATELTMSDSNSFAVGLPAFSVASGRVVSVSPETMNQVSRLFADTSSKVVTHTDCKSDTYQAKAVGGCHTALGDSEGNIFHNTLDGEGCVSPSCKALGDIHSEQVLPHTQRMSELDQVSKRPSCQVSLKTSDVCKSYTEKLPKSVSTNTCGIFSTAGGKSVQVSDAALRKTRQVFSEMEDSAQQLVYTESCHSNKGHSNKVTKESKAVIHTKDKLPSPLAGFSSRAVNSSASSGFSTASGKRVLISENALQKVKGMLEEFDVIMADCSYDSPTSVKDVSKILHCNDERVPKHCVSSKVDKTCYREFELSNNCNIESGSSDKCRPVQAPQRLSPCKPSAEQPAFRTKGLRRENVCLLGKKQTLPRNIKVEISQIKTFSNLPVKTSVDVCSRYSKDPENSDRTEAVEITNAFMEDDRLTSSELLTHARHSPLTCPPNEETAVLESGFGKRRHVLVSTGEPSIKRSLLSEFDRAVENQEKPLQAAKSTPDGVMKDRRLFRHHISLKPVSCAPFCTTEKRQEIQNPNLTAPGREFLPKSHCFERLALEKPSSSFSISRQPQCQVPAPSTGKASHLVTTGKPTKVFVPPFKTKSRFQRSERCATRNVNSEENKHTPRSVVKLGSGDSDNTVSEGRCHPLSKSSSSQAAAVTVTGAGDEPSDLIAGLQSARGLQETRIKGKQQQHVCPQPGSLYLAKTSGLPRLSLRTAVGGRAPAASSREQLYVHGVPEHCVQVNSRNAESFQFRAQDYFGKEASWAGKGVQLADGGWLIPSDDGKAGKEEFYRALCDTPGVDPKLISRDWVYNHYRWIIWKLAAMEFCFPEKFAYRCLSPERVLLQLKYRYDIEIDRSSRSALKKIMERDDAAAKTLVLCVSAIVSSSTKAHEMPSGNCSRVDSQPTAILELTDGWYAVRAQLDGPLSALVKAGRLTVGQKIITHGAELVGSQDACTPLEAPDCLMLKLSANSTRTARWHAKLGFFRDPRPFSLPLSSLFGDGGGVGCVDVVVQRAYPLQWAEKTPSGLYVFRDERGEEKAAARHEESQREKLEALLARVQAEFEEQEENAAKQCTPSRALTRQQVCALRDGAELYKAVKDAPDPGCLEDYFSDEQLRALRDHRQLLHEKKQAQVQLEFQKAVESAERGEQGLSRAVSAVWRLRLVSYKSRERGSVLLSVWRPSADVSSLLAEGRRYRICHLAASESKRTSGSTRVQLTATRRTWYQQLPASDEILLQVYQPREPLPFSKLSDPDFRPPCAEVDLVGFVVSVVKKTGFAPLVYLVDETHHLLVVKFWTDLNEDIIKPLALIAASNLQWRPEPKPGTEPGIPVLFAGDVAVFSGSPKEGHFQEAFNRMRSAIENTDVFCSDAENKLMHVLNTHGPSWSPPNEDWTSESCCARAVLGADSRFPPKGKPLSTPVSAQKTWRSCCGGERGGEGGDDRRAIRKRRALDLLGRLPAPPPVSPACTFVSPAAQRAFQPPRSRAARHEPPGKEQEMTPLKKVREASLVESESIADEELALINTQALRLGVAGQCPGVPVSDPTGMAPPPSPGPLGPQRPAAGPAAGGQEQPQSSTGEAWTAAPEPGRAQPPSRGRHRRC